MKKLLILVLLFTSIIQADLILDPDKYHTITKTVKITNVSEYSYGKVFIACIEAVMGGGGCYKISNDTSLEVGYKFNSLYLLAMPDDLLESVGGLEATNAREANTENEPIDFKTLIKNKNIPYMPMTSGIVYVDNSFEMSSDTYHFHLTSINENNITLELRKRIITFNDGTPDKIIEY